MQALSNPDLLQLWESGRRFHPLDQSLLALAAVLPGTPYETLADWPLGRRNRALAKLHGACFGYSLQGWIACTHCGEKLELEIDGRSLASDEVSHPDPHEPIVVKGHTFRVPTSRDLARLAGETDPRLAAQRLVDGCRLEGGDSPAWHEADLEEVADKMALADPLAETRLTLTCPACGHEWDETLDIAAFVWAEIEARAKRLLFEIHTLALAYSWTERDILSLSESRRALYMEMVQH